MFHFSFPIIFLHSSVDLFNKAWFLSNLALKCLGVRCPFTPSAVYPPSSKASGYALIKATMTCVETPHIAPWFMRSKLVGLWLLISWSKKYKCVKYTTYNISNPNENNLTHQQYEGEASHLYHVYELPMDNIPRDGGGNCPVPYNQLRHGEVDC